MGLFFWELVHFFYVTSANHSNKLCPSEHDGDTAAYYSDIDHCDHCQPELSSY